MPNFVDSLRMSGIYPGANNSGTTFGPPVDSQPNFDAIAKIMQMPLGAMQQNQNLEMQHQDNLMAQAHQNKIQEIAAAMGQAHDERASQPMNVQMAPSAISPLDQAKLGLESKKLGEKKSEAETKAGISQQQTDIKQQQADTTSARYHAIMDRNDLTASQKLTLMNEERLKEIAARQAGSETLQGIKGTQRTGQIEEQQKGATERTKLRGEEQLGNIAARGKAAIDTKAAPGAQSTLPTQMNRDQMNKAREIKSDPTLGQFINVDDKGNFTITPPGTSFFGSHSGPTQEQFNTIHDHIYGAPTTKSDNTKPVSKAPTAPKGWKYVPKDGGGWTAVEDTNGTTGVADSTGIK